MGYDDSGKRYLDASAGLWYCNVGHGRKVLADAAARQMGLLAGYQIFDVIANRPALELAERLRELAPLGERSGVFFTSGGSDSVDTAAKIARRYWVARGEPQRQIIICRQGAYHGVHAFGTSLSGIELNAAGWGPLVTQVIQVGRDDLPGLERVLAEHAGAIAAFIGEPVQGAAGVHPPREDYLGGSPGPLPQPRGAGHRRRGRHGIRPRRPLVRQRALRHRSRHDPLRQGHQLRLPAGRCGDRGRPCP